MPKDPLLKIEAAIAHLRADHAEAVPRILRRALRLCVEEMRLLRERVGALEKEKGRLEAVGGAA